MLNDKHETMETLIATPMSGQQTDKLNEVTTANFDRKLERGLPTATAALEAMEAEGKIMKDFIAPVGNKLRAKSQKQVISFSANGTVKLHVDKDGGLTYDIHKHALGQLAAKLKIPTTYLRSLVNGDGETRQLAQRILNDHNQWTDRSRMLLRVVGDELRGVLSDSYKRLDSPLILKAFVEQAYAQGAVMVDGLHTDTKTFLEVIKPTLLEIPTEKNGTIKAAFGARASSSDFGDGALMMQSYVMNAVCANGMTRENVMHNIHLGAKLHDNLIFSERTYKYDSKTKASAIKDATKNCFSDEIIRARAFEIQDASVVEVDIEREANNLGKRSGVTQDDVVEIKNIMMQNRPDDGVQGEATLWKWVNGITAHARNLEDGRKGRELESIAGDLMNRVKAKK